MFIWILTVPLRCPNAISLRICSLQCLSVPVPVDLRLPPFVDTAACHDCLLSPLSCRQFKTSVHTYIKEKEFQITFYFIWRVWSFLGIASSLQCNYQICVRKRARLLHSPTDYSAVTMITIAILFLLLIFVLTDANSATYPIGHGSNFSLWWIDLKLY